MITSKPLPLHLKSANAPGHTFRLPLLLRVVLSLTLVFLVPMLLICAQPGDNSVLETFFAPPVNCPAPCFMGIRPGVTPGAEAFAILDSHEWVTNLRLETYTVSLVYGKLIWDWTAAAPDVLDRAHPGSITLLRHGAGSAIDGTMVETIAIPTTARMHLAQQALGEPDARSVGIRANALAYGVTYDGRSAITTLTTMLPCPANLLTYWEGRATLFMTIWAGPDHYVQPKTVVDMC